jgi:hypothetical protein
VVLTPVTGLSLTASAAATATTAASASATVTLTVVPRVVCTAGHATVACYLTPAEGQHVVLQQLSAAIWRPVTTKLITGTTVFGFSRLPAGHYRLVVPATRDLLLAGSPTLTVR